MHPAGILAALLVSARSFAAAPPPATGTDWVAADPGGSTSDGNVSAPEKLSFWATLQSKTFDSLCRQAQIPISVGQPLGEFVDPHAEFNRTLRELPTGELAIIDDANLHGALGWLPDVAFDHGTLHADFKPFFGARVWGESAVVRRLKEKKACAQLATLADFRQIKTVLPITGERIARMQIEEIWQIPLSLQLGVGASLGDPIRFPAMVSLGAAREGDVTATLRRLDETTLRFRLRLDQARLYDAQGRLNADLPVLALGLPVFQNALVTLVADGLARAVNDFLAVQLELERHRREGIEYALEFDLDPRDGAQMDRLARALRGDLGMLALLKRAAWPAGRGPSRLSPWDRIEATAGGQRAAIGSEPAFAGEDRYHRLLKLFRFQVPVAARFERDNTLESDEVRLEDQEGGRYAVFRGEHRSRRAFLDLPGLGDLYARDGQKDVDVIAHRDADGKAQGPEIVYLQQEGFLRQDGHDARAIAEHAGDLMRLAGTRGEGANPRLELPVENLFSGAYPPNPPGAFWREDQFRRGVAALTLVFDTSAVRQILAAGAEAVLAAYVNTLSGAPRQMAQWLLDHATVGEAGFAFDRGAAWGAARAIAKTSGAPFWKVLWSLRTSAQRASALIAGLTAARAAPSPEAQASALSRLLASPARGGLAYDDALRVLIQLADPLDLSAEFFVDLVGGAGPERRARYLLHPEAGGDALLDGATRAKARFRAPSALSD